MPTPNPDEHRTSTVTRVISGIPCPFWVLLVILAAISAASRGLDGLRRTTLEPTIARPVPSSLYQEVPDLIRASQAQSDLIEHQRSPSPKDALLRADALGDRPSLDTDRRAPNHSWVAARLLKETNIVHPARLAALGGLVVVGLVAGAALAYLALLLSKAKAADREKIALLKVLPSIVILVSADRRILEWNPRASEVLRLPAEEAIGKHIDTLSVSWDRALVNQLIDDAWREKKITRSDKITCKFPDGTTRHLGIQAMPVALYESAPDACFLHGADITERLKREVETRHDQKMKAVGELAAGVAHEINTPAQYVSDNIEFAQSSLPDLFEVLDACLAIANFEVEDQELASLVEKARRCAEENDLAFLQEELPRSLAEAREGIGRVSKIVAAVKSFAHPGDDQAGTCDLHKILRTTATVAASEIKRVASVEWHLAEDDLDVTGFASDLSQAFLNLLVNAAHAIQERKNDHPDLQGCIRISTHVEDDHVEIQFSDNGTGIPEEILARVFEPFFTTKGVGKGTGQGLAFVHNVVVDRHSGSLSIDSTLGAGTTFFLKLPL